ncbi:molybdopterin-binding domain-containing protein [Gluconacetobacter diazotrophicus]|uniref:hypothetical protein n=1 Tax=Gluconacetobacter diazotrophicus TaxID=33996 RepID=UPI0021806AE2|nr:hypothetical protein [Gluconacetobacter diazotrophicus]
MPSLDGLPGDEREWIGRFPHLEQALAHPLDRRRTLKLMALALAGGGLAGCDPGTPDRGFVSAVRAAPGVIPGVPNVYASAHVRDGYANGILVTHQMGRPTKVEGNPGHPSSLGATDVFAQAAIQDFYDPDRASGPLHDGMPAAWQEVTTALQVLRAAPNGGVPQGASGLRILTGTVTSPTLGAAIDALLAAYPGAIWHRWDAIGRDTVRQGAELAYGRPAMVIPDLRQVDVALAVDSDLLDSAPSHLRHARAFAGRRNPVQGPMNRLYAVEPTPSLTGAAADHRFITAPAACDEIIGRLAAAVLRNEAPSGGPDWLGAVVADLRAHPGLALIHLGPDHGAQAQAAVHAMNEALGGRGRAFDVFDAPDHRPARPTSTLPALMDDMENGRVRALLILDVNPVYQVPRFAAALPRVPLRACLESHG